MKIEIALYTIRLLGKGVLYNSLLKKKFQEEHTVEHY